MRETPRGRLQVVNAKSLQAASFGHLPPRNHPADEELSKVFPLLFCRSSKNATTSPYTNEEPGPAQQSPAYGGVHKIAHAPFELSKATAEARVPRACE
jgi:hypothetical protein